MLRDTLDVMTNTAKLLLLGLSIYTVVMIAKPEELELRKGQLGEWWTQIVLSRNDSTKSSDSSPEARSNPDETWGF